MILLLHLSTYSGLECFGVLHLSLCVVNTVSNSSFALVTACFRGLGGASCVGLTKECLQMNGQLLCSMSLGWGRNNNDCTLTAIMKGLACCFTGQRLLISDVVT